MARMQVDIEDSKVIAILKQNHQFNDEGAIRSATEIEFDSRPRVSNQAAGVAVTVSLKYLLSEGEIEKLLE